jgi:diguanylate cyclase (GGDEF)-like protein/PAS domain S-box-containing protein
MAMLESDNIDQLLDCSAEIQDVTELLSVNKILFDTSLDNIAIYDITGKLVYENPTLTQTFAFKKNVGVADFNFRTQPEFDQYYDALHQTLVTGESRALLITLEHPCLNRVIYDLVHFSVIKNQVGKIIGAIAVGRDLDFYKQQQSQEVGQREQYLRALLDTFPFIVWMKDQEGRFLATNHKFVEIVGANSFKDLIGKTDFDFFPVEMAQGYVDDDNEILKTGIAQSVTEQIKKDSGEVYWAETYKSPVRLNDEVIGTVGFARDITERLRLQSEIAKQNKAYQSLVHSLPMVVIRYDRDGRRIFANSQCEYMFDIDVSTAMHKTPAEAWSPYVVNMTGQGFMAELMDAMQSDIHKKFELHSIYQDIMVVHQVRIVPEYDETREICGALTIATDITELAEYRRKVENMAYHDALTGLPNRALFVQKLTAAIAHAKSDNSAFALMMLDLDQFKSINDTMGHAVGDKLLVVVADRISDVLGGEYLCARLGGDEFIIVVDQLSNRAQVERLSNTLLSQLMQVYVIDGVEYFISASIGIAYYPYDSEDESDLLKYADSAMYYAKKNGRNRYHVYSSNLTKSIQERLNVETELRRAIGKSELYLEYQPIVDIASKRVIGLETLCRWKSCKLGVVSPATFIQIAEETGMIVELGKWVIQEAFQAARLINHHLVEPIPISINLSARQFLEVYFADQVNHLLQQQQCNPAWIKFEITESLLLESNQQVLKTLDAFNNLGIKISLDDFGTGQSALAYLSKFPIHQVKIDYSFVKEITNNANDALLVKAIVALAATLNKELVAEGVETEAQAALLGSYNCKYAQGYLYSKSIGLDAVQQYLAVNNA